jgi:mono/diheme cytochrome c family protein
MKLVKRIAIGLALFVALAVGAVLVKFYALSPRMRAAPGVTAPRTPEAIERGRYLANHVFACVGCHSKVQGQEPGEPMVPGQAGSGRDFGDIPGFPGRVRAPNLTPDAETGLGRWTDGEILRAMREGVSRDGRPLFPMMPYLSYSAVSDADALSVIAYLRSLPAIRNDPGKMTVNFPVSMFARAAPAPLDGPVPAAPSEPLARGQWLLKVASCGDCHDSVDSRHQPIPGKHLAGGQLFPIPGRGKVYSANITSDPATGIGSYSDEDILRAITQGVSKTGRPLFGMPWRYYAGMTDEDKRALILALRSVPAVTNLVPVPDLKLNP